MPSRPHPSRWPQAPDAKLDFEAALVKLPDGAREIFVRHDVDCAIAEARRALETDPGNVYLNGHFAATRRRKLELLRQASALAHTES